MPPLIALSDTLETIIRYYPAAAQVLLGRKIDLCCGGRRTLAEAARDAAIAPDELLAAVQAAAETRSCSWG